MYFVTLITALLFILKSSGLLLGFGTFPLSSWLSGFVFFFVYLFEVNGRPVLYSCSLIFNVSPLQIPLSSPPQKVVYRMRGCCV